MRVPHLAAAGLLVFALLAPAAAGYVQPIFYFLKSGCPVDEVDGMCPVPEVPLPAVPEPPLPLPVPIPTVGVPKFIVADGVLDAYNFSNPNAPNSTEPDVKLVYPGSESAAPVRFVTPAGHAHPDRIKGSFLVGLWTGESPVPNGNLTTTLYEIKPDGTAVALAEKSVAIDLNVSKVPDPTAVVPPNSTEPMAIAYYELAQVLPLVLVPPMLFLLGPVDVQVDPNSTFAMGFQLDQGSSQFPEPPGAVTVNFNSTLNPSFVYVPWYTPDPPKPSYTKTPSTFTKAATKSASKSGTSGLQGDDDKGHKKGGNGIPGVEAPLVLTLLAAAAFAARRKLK